jgi:hypothetical protein
MTMAAIDAEEVAILGIELYFPKTFIEQSELGKISVGSLLFCMFTLCRIF